MSEKFTFVINTYKKLIQKIYFSVFLVTSDGNDERYQDVKATIDTIEDNKIKIEMTTESDNMFLLTEVAGEGGTDCPPQKFLSSQKFRHLMG